MKIEPFCLDIDDDCLAQFQRLLQRPKLSGSSDLVREYEARLADYFGVRHALAFSSGTAAIHGALGALGLGPGDEVILPPTAPVMSGLPVLFQNAVPIFVDVNPHSFDINLADLQQKITPRTRAVVCVPMWGYPLNVDDVVRLCDERGIPVVEDIAQATGATVQGRKL
jgi:perosamine synthetase